MSRVSNIAEVIVPATKFFAESSDTSSIETEQLFGERMEILGECGEFFNVTSERYLRPGYVRKKDVKRYELHRRSVGATHRVSAVRANVYQCADFKCPKPYDTFLTMNALARVTAYDRTPEGEMAFIEGMGWVFQDQLHCLDESYTDYVSVALMYVGGPATYTWGSLVFPDCSGLLQQALWACGIDCPRNVSEQIAMLGVDIDMDQSGFTYKRGDFVFMFDPERSIRHVVIMIDERNCVHSTIAAPYRGVVVQPLRDVIAYQFKGELSVPSAVRRFPLRN